MDLKKQAMIDRWQKWFRISVFVLLVTITIDAPFHKVTTGLDASWKYLFNIVNQLGLKAGSDYLFTFGPLGFLAATINVPGTSNAIISVAFWAAIQLVYAFLLLRLLFFDKSLLVKPINAMLSMALLVIVLPFTMDYYLPYLVMFALALSWFSRKKIGYYVIACVVTTLMLFIKFSSAISAVTSMVIYLLIFLFKDRKTFVKLALVSLLIPVFFLSGYLIYNPSFNDLAAYIKSISEISGGYISAMSLNMNNASLLLAIATGGSFIIFLIYMFFKDANKALFMLLFSGVLFVGFKHGFVRADGHNIIFFKTASWTFSIIVLFLNFKEIFADIKEKLFAQKSVYYIVLGAMMVLLLMPFIKIDRSARYPLKVYMNKVTQVSVAKNPYAGIDDLPEAFLQELGDSTVAIYPWEISYIVENDINFVTMPVIQAYSAYTPYLDDINASFFSKDESAPEYIIFDMDTVDYRLPLIENPDTWEAIYENYYAVLADGDLLLLKRLETAFEPTKTTLGTETALKDDTINLPKTDGIIEVKINMELNLLGKLAAVFFRVSDVNMAAVSDGQVTAYGRVIVDNLSQGFIASCLADDVISGAWLINEGETFSRTDAIAFSGAGLKYYKDEITVEYIAYEGEKTIDEMPKGLYAATEVVSDPTGDLNALKSGRAAEIILVNDGHAAQTIEIEASEGLNVLGWTSESTKREELIASYLKIGDTMYRLNVTEAPILALYSGDVTAVRKRGISGYIDTSGFDAGTYEVSLVTVIRSHKRYFENETEWSVTIK